MFASRIAAALLVSAVLLTGSAALAGPRNGGTQAPPVHMTPVWLPAPHASTMKPFVTPKRFAYAPYTPLYLPTWGYGSVGPFALGGLGLNSTACQSAPQTLGELGGGGFSGFAPVALGAQPMSTLGSASLATGTISPQAYCQQQPLGWSNFTFDF